MTQTQDPTRKALIPQTETRARQGLVAQGSRRQIHSADSLGRPDHQTDHGERAQRHPYELEGGKRRQRAKWAQYEVTERVDAQVNAATPPGTRPCCAQ